MVNGRPVVKTVPEHDASNPNAFALEQELTPENDKIVAADAPS